MIRWDKRRFKRVSIEHEIGCYLPIKDEYTRNRIECLTRDISPKGVRLVMPAYTKKGYEMVLLLEEPLALMPILLKGRIAWIKEIRSTGGKTGPEKEAGVEFTHISLYDFGKLHRFMQEVKKHNVAAR